MTMLQLPELKINDELNSVYSNPSIPTFNKEQYC